MDVGVFAQHQGKEAELLEGAGQLTRALVRLLGGGGVRRQPGLARSPVGAAPDRQSAAQDEANRHQRQHAVSRLQGVSHGTVWFAGQKAVSHGRFSARRSGAGSGRDRR
ncbi:hypothetical protein D3C73_884280 [compost metagenome]